MPVGEILLSAFLQVVFDRLASRELTEFALRWKVKPKLEKLRTTLLAIQAVLNDAEEKQIKSNAVRVWLDNLQNLAYDAEDLLDEFATETLRRNIEADSQIHTDQVCSFITPCIRPTAFKSNFVISSKIKKITEKLEEIVKEKQDLGLMEGVGQISSEVRGRQTTSLVNEFRVYGRDEDVNKIIELLLLDEPSDNVVSVIPIVGMGGVGKTTLAQVVYNHESLENHFDLKAWACVSDDFDVKRVTIAILESATKNSYDVMNLDPLQARLKEVLNGKKFLLVLDDVWSEKYNDWDELRKPFRAGAQGSKIIVTTRDRDVASMMGSVPAHDLCLLSDDNCWSLFTQHAFENRNPDAHPNLKTIDKKIMKRCGGLPLVAKTLGGLLRSKVRIDDWVNILNSEIWRNNEGGILPALRVSYHHLPAHLKRCFAYCAIFPKDYEFDEEDLVLLWMAEGFVQPKENKRLEDTGGEYFRDLLRRSFFQQGCIKESRFSMHDLVNDLAQSVSREICFRLEDRLGGNMKHKVPKKARHSSYLRGEYDRVTIFQPFYEVESLRTFLPFDRLYQNYYYLPNQVPNDLFLKLRCLRVLRLSGYNISVLPDSIGNLKHLRYLDLSYTTIERLPESMSTLYNLQTLKLNYCLKLTELPKDLVNLINLRHLEISGFNNLKIIPLGIGRLTSLQSLSNFVMGNNNGRVIRELREMVHLRGSLCISMLKNVVNVADAIDAKLKNKQHLHTLILSWSSYVDSEDDSRDEVEEKVLAQLQPHTNLENLTIRLYGGTRFPSWIGDPLFSNIVSLKLSHCRKCESLPPLGQLPSLKYLEIWRLYGVKSVGREFYGNGSVEPFPSLEILKFCNMLKWEEWSVVEEFPCLRKIQIDNCPKLRRFSFCSPSLEELVIRECVELSSLSNGIGLQHFASLRRLQISYCPQLMSLSNEDTGLPTKLEHLEISGCKNLEKLPQGLHNLKFLEITECKNLKSLPQGMIYNNVFLKRLKIRNCDSLTSFPRGGLPTSLEHLCINGCSSLESLPEGMQNNTSIKELEIQECHSLTSFTSGLWIPTATLKSLEICDCKNLESLPMGLYNLTSLDDLKIGRCPLLMSFPAGGLPTTLKSIEIRDCCNIEFLLDGLHNLASLHDMKIWECPGLVSFPEGGLFPRALSSIDIFSCENLKSLPNWMHSLTSLQYLEIVECPSLVSFPEEGLPTNLETLEIKQCKNLKSLSHRMHNLTSLQGLKIESCPSLFFPEEGFPTNLIVLFIEDCENLEQPLSEWGVQRLTSLACFCIRRSSRIESFSELLLPITITYFSIDSMPNLESLPKGLHSLTSLEVLSISNCHKLASFPEEGLPTMLCKLLVTDCPLLRQRCHKRKGADWPKIAHIPRIEI